MTMAIFLMKRILSNDTNGDGMDYKINFMDCGTKISDIDAVSGGVLK